MSESAVFHVVPSGDVWAVKRRGDGEAARLAPTRERALEHAHHVAGREAPSRIVLHRDDGTIERQVLVGEGDGYAPGWRNWLTSPPVLTGIAGALVVAAAAIVFTARR